MRRTRSPNNAASLPAITGSETGGYWTEGPPATIVSAADLNIIQEELVALATMKGAALDATGATHDQCKTALEGALGIEAKSAEATGVDTYRSLVVIASDDATVGETDGGVVHALVAASNSCAAKGFESAVIASKDSRAGKADGTTITAAVIASSNGRAEGDSSAVIASSFSVDDPGATGPRSAMVACGGDSTAEASGVCSFAAGSFGPIVSGDYSVAIGGDSHTVSGASSAALAGISHTVSGTKSAAIGSGGSAISGDESASLAAGIATVSGTRAAAIAAVTVEVTQNQAAIVGCSSSKNRSNAHSVMLASKFCDSAASTVPPEGSVYGGWDAATHVEPSWRLESNGGHVRGAGTVASGGLDYAEWFDNGDGVPHEPGLILTRRGRRAMVAQPGDRILGIPSVHPSVVGGDDSLAWRGKWIRDEWGRLLVGPDGGRVLNPAYDPERAQHTPRSERPAEKTLVGLLGQLLVRVDATVAVDDDVVAGRDGIGTRGVDAVFLGAQLECMEIVSPYDAQRGYAIALCLLR